MFELVPNAQAAALTHPHCSSLASNALEARCTSASVAWGNVAKFAVLSVVRLENKLGRVVDICVRLSSKLNKIFYK